MAHSVRDFTSSSRARHQTLPAVYRAHSAPPLRRIEGQPPVPQYAYLDLTNLFRAGAQVAAHRLGMAGSPAEAAERDIGDPRFRVHARALLEIVVGTSAVNPRCVAVGSVIDPTDTRLTSAWQRAGWLLLMRLRSPGRREKGVETLLSLTMQRDLLFNADPAEPKQVTLISGDEDMLSVVEELHASGIGVDVASFDHVLSDKLRKLARRVTLLDDYFDVLARRKDLTHAIGSA